MSLRMLSCLIRCRVSQQISRAVRYGSQHMEYSNVSLLYQRRVISSVFICRDTCMSWQTISVTYICHSNILTLHLNWQIPFFDMGWLRLVGSLKFQVSFAKEPYKRDYTLQKRPIILRSLLIVATPYHLNMRECHVKTLYHVALICQKI